MILNDDYYPPLIEDCDYCGRSFPYDDVWICPVCDLWLCPTCAHAHNCEGDDEDA